MKEILNFLSLRIAYPNLTLLSPSMFRMMPQKDKIIVGQLDGEIYWFDDNETTVTKTNY